MVLQRESYVCTLPGYGTPGGQLGAVYRWEGKDGPYITVSLFVSGVAT